MAEMSPFWEEKYRELAAETGNTPAERKALAMLQSGRGIMECKRESGLPAREFSKLLDRAKAWEIRNLCIPTSELEETADESVHQRVKKED